MKDWGNIAKAQGLDLSARDADRIVAALAELERTFQPLAANLPPDLEPYKDDNAAFFFEPLPGRDGPIGSPGGAARVGAYGADTPLVASHPVREPD